MSLQRVSHTEFFAPQMHPLVWWGVHVRPFSTGHTKKKLFWFSYRNSSPTLVWQSESLAKGSIDYNNRNNKWQREARSDVWSECWVWWGLWFWLWLPQSCIYFCGLAPLRFNLSQLLPPLHRSPQVSLHHRNIICLWFTPTPKFYQAHVMTLGWQDRASRCMIKVC